MGKKHRFTPKRVKRAMTVAFKTRGIDFKKRAEDFHRRLQKANAELSKVSMDLALARWTRSGTQTRLYPLATGAYQAEVMLIERAFTDQHPDVESAMLFAVGRPYRTSVEHYVDPRTLIDSLEFHGTSGPDAVKALRDRGRVELLQTPPNRPEKEQWVLYVYRPFNDERNRLSMVYWSQADVLNVYARIDGKKAPQ